MNWDSFGTSELVTRSQLLDCVWGWDFCIDESDVTVHSAASATNLVVTNMIWTRFRLLECRIQI